MTTLTIENFASAFPAVNALPYAQSAIGHSVGGYFIMLRQLPIFPNDPAGHTERLEPCRFYYSTGYY